MIDIDKDPYNSPFDKEYNKGYRKILSLPGRVLQAKEITSLSLTPLKILEDFLNTVYNDGEVIYGINLSEQNKITKDVISLVGIDNIIEIVDI